jgi:TonB family protein
MIEPTTKVCSACGTSIAEASKFCPDCGAAQIHNQSQCAEPDEMRLYDIVAALNSAIKNIEPIWDTAKFLCNVDSEGRFPDCSFKEALALDFFNAVADIGECVSDTRLTGRAIPAVKLTFLLLEETAPEELFPPMEIMGDSPSEQDERRAWQIAFVAGCKELRIREPRDKFWEPLSIIGLEAYDALQDTNYGLLPAKVFVEYFRELKRVPELAKAAVLHDYIRQLEEFISTEKESVPVNCNTGSLTEPNCLKNPATNLEHVTAADDPSYNVGSHQGSENVAWRYLRVGLRTVWRITKIVAVSTFCLLIAAMILLQVFMFLYEHWNSESKRGRGTGSGGFETEKFFAFLNGVTWLPQQIWQGLVLIVTIVFLALIVAGKWVGEQALANITVVGILASIGAVTLLVWVFAKERKAEFEPNSTDPQATTMSWVLGLVVLISSAGASVWWIQDGRARFAQDFSPTHQLVTTQGANDAPAQPETQSSVDSTPSTAALPLNTSRCNAEADEQNVPLWNGFSLRLSPVKSPPDSGCMAVVMGAGEKTAWSGTSSSMVVLPVTGQDINGDGAPELVLEAFSGGAHCCWTYYILTLTPTPEVVELPAESGAKFEPARQGGFVIHTWDESFDYFDGLDHVSSSTIIPDLFLRLDGSVFRDVSSDRWPTFQKKIDDARKRLNPGSVREFRDSTGHGFQLDKHGWELIAAKSEILTIVLEYLYGGRPQQAWREFESMWPESDQNRMRQLIEDTRAKGLLGRTHAVEAGLRDENHLTEPPASPDADSDSGHSVEGAAGDLPSSDSSIATQVQQSVCQRIPQNVVAGRLLQKAQPVYPPVAKQARIQGAVVLAAVIASDGTIKEIHATSGQPMLIQSAIDAVRQWRYEPYRLCGEPTEVNTQIIVNFTLAGG